MSGHVVKVFGTSWIYDMFSRWQVRNIKRFVALSVTGIACYFFLEIVVNSDGIDYESTNSFQVTLIHNRDGSMHNLSLESTHNAAFASFVSDPYCQWDTLGAPEGVRKAGCNKGECDIITCRRILSNDSEALLAATEFMDARKWSPMEEHEVLKLASNCIEFRRRGRYQDKPLRPSDLEFPVAFNLLIHWHLEQFERLLRALYRPQNVYCIHVDAKTSYTFHAAVEAIARCFDNVFVATKRHRIVYAGFSRLEADIDCMRDHLNRKSPVRWHYLLNVAGQSYPLRTPEEMVDILRIYNGSNDIEGLALNRRLKHRYEKVHIESFDEDRMIETNGTMPPPPHDIEIVRGSAYGIFSRGFVEFVVNSQLAQDFLEWSRSTYSPDEHFWSTLHHNYANPHVHVPGSFRGQPEDKPFVALYAKWYPDDSCFGTWKRGICILGVGDLPGLLTRPEFFINKFAIDYQPLAYECLEAWLEQRVLCPTPFNLDFYRRLPFINR